MMSSNEALENNHQDNNNKVKEVAPFLKNLRKMLEIESDDILRWTPNGHAFEIHDMEKMMEYVLPKYFKHRKYTSFQRQLNYFNFKKWTKSKAVVCTFSNEYFVRDQPELSWRITRKKSVQLGSFKGTPTHKPVMQQPSRPVVNQMVEPMWKSDEINIMVPRKNQNYPTEAYPSPIDMEMMLLENDYENQRYYSSTDSSTYDGEVDSLDWIDSLLPSIEMHSKMDAHAYIDSINEPTLRSGPYGYPPLPASYNCLTTAM
jgi:hypothetical protein